jgi:hypothetical protein
MHNTRVVRGSEAVEGIGAESRWTTATQGLTGAYVATVKGMLDAVGREKYNEIMVQIWAEAGKASRQTAEVFGLEGHDASSAAEAARRVSIASMGPEFSFEVTEATPERAAFRYHECQWWNRMMELGISDDLCSAACPEYWNAAVKNFNPKLTAGLSKAKPWGDPYCEHVCELQE